MPSLNITPRIKPINIGFSINRMLHEDYVLIIGPETILAEGIDANEWERQITERLNQNGIGIKDAYVNGNLKISIDDVDEKIRELLKTRCFKVVITTITHPFLEKVFDEVWGKDENDIPNYDICTYAAREKGNPDIAFSERLIASGDFRPVLIYLFGNISDCTSNDYDESATKYTKWRAKRESKRIATDEFGFMEAISYWLQPKKLHTLLKQRKLLALGGKYDDWAFRFLLYALKGFEYERHDDLQESISDVSIIIDEEKPSDITLRNYLANSNIAVNGSDIKDFIGRILDGYKRRREELIQEQLEDEEKTRYDVFLSYASEDEPLANRLYRILTQRGIRVWMDYPLEENPNLVAYERYKEVIDNAIERSTCFIALLSPNVKTALEKDAVNPDETTHRFFHRVEWNRARKLGKPIFPVAAGILSRCDVDKVGWRLASEEFWPDERVRLDNEVQLGFMSDIEILCTKISEYNRARHNER